MINTPIARNTDPDTSHLAAEKYKGKRGIRQWQVLDLVNRYPNRTSGELARIFVREHPEMSIVAAAETPHKRISDLLAKGLVRKVIRRKCNDSGYECWSYCITSLGRESV